MEREACVCDHGFERSDLCAEIIIIIIITKVGTNRSRCLYVVRYRNKIRSMDRLRGKISSTVAS